MRTLLFFLIFLCGSQLLAIEPQIHNVVVLNVRNGEYEFSSLENNEIIIFGGPFFRHS